MTKKNQQFLAQAIVLMEGELAQLKKVRSKLLKQQREQKALSDYLTAQLVDLRDKQLVSMAANANVLSSIKQLNRQLKAWEK